MDNLSLTKFNRDFLNGQVASGIYNSLNDALNATIKIYIEHIAVPDEQILQLRKDIEEAKEDIKAGRVFEGLEFMDDLIINEQTEN